MLDEGFVTVSKRKERVMFDDVLERHTSERSHSAPWLFKPPPNETSTQRQRRLDDEEAEKRRSDAIDQVLKEEAASHNRAAASQRTLLLLGQARAGKTTILKQMQRLYAPERQDQIRHAWTDVVYLNLVLAIKTVLDTLEVVLAEQRVESLDEVIHGSHDATSGSPVARNLVLQAIALAPVRRVPSRISGQSEKDLSVAAARRSQSPTSPYTIPSRDIASSPSPSSPAETNPLMMQLQEEEKRILHFRLRLAPLLSLEAHLRQKLGTFEAAPKVAARGSAGRDQYSCPPAQHNALRRSLSMHLASMAGKRTTPIVYEQNIVLKASWQQMIAEAGAVAAQATKPLARNGTTPMPRSAVPLKSIRRSESFHTLPLSTSAKQADLDVRAAVDARQGKRAHKNVGGLLRSFAEDIGKLWCLGQTRDLRCHRRFLQAEAAPYFLDSVQRIASPEYVPTDDDILHARVRTVGATEDVFKVAKHIDYRVIDVGGCRTQRLAWAQFFGDATAIIFLAPLSSFNEVRTREDIHLVSSSATIATCLHLYSLSSNT